MQVPPVADSPQKGPQVEMEEWSYKVKEPKFYRYKSVYYFAIIEYIYNELLL